MFRNPPNQSGIAFERPGARRHRHRHAKAVKKAYKPPDARAAAIFEMGFGPEITHCGADLQVKFAPIVVPPITVRYGIFRALFVSKNEIDRDKGTTRPSEARSISSISNEVPFRSEVGFGLCHGFTCHG